MAKAKSKKPAAKKSPAKAKPTAKKAPAKPVKKATAKAKKGPATKAPTKKPAQKKAAPKKPPAKKAAAKKPAAKKPTPKKQAATPAPATPADTIMFVDVTAEREAAESTEAKKGFVAKLVDKVKSVVGGSKAKPAPGHRPPPPASETPVGLSPELKARIQAALPDGSFAEHVRNLSVHAEDAWAHADMPELVGLERWGRELAQKDKLAGIAALVEAARFGFPRAGEAGREELVDAGFFADHASADGAPVETQIEVCAAWLDNPEHLDAVKNALDQTRQLNVWDDDLRPEDGRAYWWYTEVGQCCCAAIIRDDGKPDGDTYYEWDPATIIGRGLVMAVRGIRLEDANVDEILDEMRDAMLA
jgi:hypothetical protein